MVNRLDTLMVVHLDQPPVQGIYGFGGAERLHVVSRPLVLAAVALRAATGFGFNIRGDLIGLVASREDPEDYDYIRRLHATIEEIGRERDWIAPHDLEYVGTMSPETASLHLEYVVTDVLDFADDSDLLATIE